MNTPQGCHAPPESFDMVRYPAAAAITGISTATLYAMVHQRRIPHYRLGPRFVVFSVTELKAWLASRKVLPAPVRTASP